MEDHITNGKSINFSIFRVIKGNLLEILLFIIGISVLSASYILNLGWVSLIGTAIMIFPLLVINIKSRNQAYSEAKISTKLLQRLKIQNILWVFICEILVVIYMGLVLNAWGWNISSFPISTNKFLINQANFLMFAIFLPIILSWAFLPSLLLIRHLKTK